MAGESLLEGKRVLLVDDERDVLETLSALLTMCEIATASSFSEAEKLLQDRDFDIAVLDIMGVEGYRILERAHGKNMIAVMLTAHALSPEDTVKSFRKGAAFFIPKEKMSEIATYLEDVLEAREKGKSTWGRWMERFNAYYERVFGPDWKDHDKEFWKKFLKYYTY